MPKNLAQHIFMAIAALGLAWGSTTAWAGRGGNFTLRVVDHDTKQPIAGRMHLKDPRGRSVRPPDVPYWNDHFAFDGTITFSVRSGHYTFEIERGLEYRKFTGYFEMRDNAEDSRTVELHRFVDMAAGGWYSGDLNAHRDIKDIDLLMRADDLYVCPIITWRQTASRLHRERPPLKGLVPVAGNRFAHGLAGQDDRAGGTLSYFNLEQPLEFGTVDAESPTPARFIVQAKDMKSDVHIDVEKPFGWDLPVWLASRRIDSIGLAHSHLLRDGLQDDEGGGRPRDRTLYPPPAGLGRWTEAIYYHALNAGLRIPPSAGSGSGLVANPLGYNRVYVQCGDTLNYEDWFANLRAGKVVVTNGPLIQIQVEGHPPGHVFRCASGTPREFQPTLTLSTRERIDYLEIVKNGQPRYTIRLEEYKSRKGQLPKLKFTESGWFLVRVVTNNDKTHHFATTGPYYVDFDEQPRVSRASAQFFLDWVIERAKALRIADPAQRADAMRYHRAAHDFWQDRVEQATTD